MFWQDEIRALMQELRAAIFILFYLSFVHSNSLVEERPCLVFMKTVVQRILTGKFLAIGERTAWQHEGCLLLQA
jgi:hypothetical protein